MIKSTGSRLSLESHAPRGSIGGVNLGINSPGTTGGLGVLLDRPPEQDFDYTTQSGARVVLTAGTEIAVCHTRDPRVASADSALEVCYAAVQEALDVFAARRGWWHDTPEGWAQHLLWWRDPLQGTVARWVDFSPMTVRSEVSWVLNRADGTSDSSENAPPPPWREAWRYLRYSQTTPDLFDAYRTAYLALESVLSSVRPKAPGESERAWTLDALRTLVALGADLRTFILNSAVSDPALAFYDEQYKAHRCAQDHAKLGAPRYLPGTIGDREQVTTALLNLAGFVSHAISCVDGGGSGVGITTLAGIQMHAEVSKDMVLHVTADPTPMTDSDTAISPLGAPTTMLETKYLGAIDAIGYDYGWLGERKVADMSSPVVRRTAGTVVDDRPGSAGNDLLMIAGNVPELELSGVDVFQYATAFVWTVNGGIKPHYRR